MLSVKCGSRSGYNNHLKIKEPPCDECKKAHKNYLIEYYKNNPEKRKKYSKQYTEKNKEKIKKYKKDFYQLNKECLLKKSKEYYERNKQKNFARTRRRKIKLRESVYDLYSVEEIIELYGNICHICNEEIDTTLPRSTGVLGWQKGLHLDHVVPISKGGTDTVSNIRPAHAICNLSKGSTILEGRVC